MAAPERWWRQDSRTAGRLSARERRDEATEHGEIVGRRRRRQTAGDLKRRERLSEEPNRAEDVLPRLGRPGGVRGFLVATTTTMAAKEPIRARTP
jgi:hypothetical protein